MSNISKLKRSNGLQAIKNQADSYQQKFTDYKDTRYWQPVVDQNNNGQAIIRFLPGIQIPDSEDFEAPFVRKWSHGFKGPSGVWYIENNRNTIDEKDPVTDFNSKLWKSGNEEDKSQARRQKRKLSYISNIMVLKHPARPEDEGKVFLYKYGQKIMDKIMEKAIPPVDELEPEKTPQPVPVFDFWEGANFRLKVKNVEGFRNYDSSSFDTPSALSEDDAELETIFGQEYSLAAEVAPDKFKSYEELEAKLWEVLNEAPRQEAPSEAKTGAARSIPMASRTTEPKAAQAEAPPWDTEEVVDEDGVVTEKPVASTSGSAFFAKLKAAKV